MIESGRRTSLIVTGIVIFAMGFSVLGALIFTAPGFVGTDDYYHARISMQIIEQGSLRLDFPWLPRTILSPEAFTDHHLLYHMYIAPWMALGGMTGVKLAAAAIGAGVLVAIWSLLRQIGVRWAALWALLLLGLSAPFLLRLLMIRTQGASLLLLIVALAVLFSSRHRWLIPLAFAYAWLYNGFILLLAFAAAYTLGAWIAERRLYWSPLVYTALGLGLGLVINPYFPQNLSFISDHLLAKVDFEGGVRVGSEWYPYTTGALLENSGVLLALFGLSMLAPSFSGRKRDTVENTLLLVALITLFMLLRSRRFIEYFPAFALLYSAAAWGRGTIRIGDWLPARLRPSTLMPTLGILLTLVLVNLTYNDARRSLLDGKAPDYLAGASAWLAENTPTGSLVFQTDWDDFTRLFFYNTHSTYLVGLDPTYLQIADPELWDLWVHITQGKVTQPSAVIRSIFGAEYVVSDTQHEAFAEQANADPAMALVYRDDLSLVWRIDLDSAETVALEPQ